MIAERLATATGEAYGAALGSRLRDELVTSDADRTALVELIHEMVSADPLLAQTAPSIGALLRSAIASQAVSEAFMPTAVADDLEDAAAPDDVLRIARVHGQAEASVLSNPMFDAARAARAMGSRSANVREYARQLRTRPGVLALPVANRFVFPSFQFDEPRRRLWPIALEINALLGAADDPWGVASFWFGDDPGLGARPADLVSDESRAQDVRAAAARELAPVG
ncbi:MAG: hypothetical protein U0667_18030 [Chloroflexota bacterium]